MFVCLCYIIFTEILTAGSHFVHCLITDPAHSLYILSMDAGFDDRLYTTEVPYNAYVR